MQPKHIALTGLALLLAMHLVKSKSIALTEPIGQHAQNNKIQRLGQTYKFEAELLSNPTDTSKLTLKHTGTGELFSVYPSNPYQRFDSSPYGTATVVNNAGTYTLTGWSGVTQAPGWFNPLGRVTRYVIGADNLYLYIDQDPQPYVGTQPIQANPVGLMAYGLPQSRTVIRLAPVP